MLEAIFKTAVGVACWATVTVVGRTVEFLVSLIGG